MTIWYYEDDFFFFPRIVGMKSTDTSSSKNVAFMHLCINSLVSFLYDGSRLLSLLCFLLFLYWILQYCHSQRLCPMFFHTLTLYFLPGTWQVLTTNVLVSLKSLLLNSMGSFLFCFYLNCKQKIKQVITLSSLEYFFLFRCYHIFLVSSLQISFSSASRPPNTSIGAFRFQSLHWFLTLSILSPTGISSYCNVLNILCKAKKLKCISPENYRKNTLYFKNYCLHALFIYSSSYYWEPHCMLSRIQK